MMNDRDNKHINSDLQFKLKEDDWDEEFKKDLGLESESASQTTSTPNELANSKSMNYLEEVIEEVIQEALDYANAPEDKRVLPALVRKAAKVKPKTLPPHISSGNGNANNFNTPQPMSQPQNQGNSVANVTNSSLQQQSQQVVSTSSVNTNNGLLMSSNHQTTGGFHPLVQANLTPAGMQQMLQLAAASNNKNLAAQQQQATQHNVNNASQQHQQQQQQQAVAQQHQQQLTNQMMGFSATQLPNVIMPTYNTNLGSNYTQQGQYQLPVSLSQIQLAQQHLLLGNNPNSFTDASNQQNHLNFVNQNAQLLQQQSNNPTNFSMSPYQLSGMIQPYASSSAPQQSNSNDDDHNNHALNLNGAANTTSSSNNFQQQTNKNTSNSGSNNSSSALTSNNNNSNNNSSSTSSSTNPVATLYQTGANNSSTSSNPFDLQQSHLYAQQRLLQQQTQQLSSAPNMFPDYAAVMARYGAYH